MSRERSIQVGRIYGRLLIDQGGAADEAISHLVDVASSAT
jgi:hypothetical protein